MNYPNPPSPEITTKEKPAFKEITSELLRELENALNNATLWKEQVNLSLKGVKRILEVITGMDFFQKANEIDERLRGIVKWLENSSDGLQTKMREYESYFNDFNTSVRSNEQEVTNILNANAENIKSEIKSELDNLLSDRELKSELQQAKSEIVSETTNETTNALTSKILGILESQLNAITESAIKNLDFSFLATQPKAFYSVINENLKEMFLNELESEYLQKYINSVIETYFKQAERLKLLRETELQALCYLQVTLESNKVKMLQDALMLENQNTQNELKIQNEIAYHEKRKQLIADGQLEDESFKQFKFKVI